MAILGDFNSGWMNLGYGWLDKHREGESNSVSMDGLSFQWIDGRHTVSQCMDEEERESGVRKKKVVYLGTYIVCGALLSFCLRPVCCLLSVVCCILSVARALQPNELHPTSVLATR